ncbi:hypothetical protein ACFT0G_32230 [Streptomyces sp. NPDC057020]
MIIGLGTGIFASGVGSLTLYWAAAAGGAACIAVMGIGLMTLSYLRS